MAIATRIPEDGHKPIQIRAEALRNIEAFAPYAGRGFAPMPDHTAPTPKDDKAEWLDADLKRALAAAEEAGLRAYRVEIAPDGTISIIVGAAT